MVPQSYEGRTAGQRRRQLCDPLPITVAEYLNQLTYPETDLCLAHSSQGPVHSWVGVTDQLSIVDPYCEQTWPRKRGRERGAELYNPL